ncbi:cell division protein ZipA C-terminal FtsZ-binding domain-containing protein [Psychrobacter aestuarii]|uniref:Cell division protein ZipA n=1 Tax=Psychrobacter aestuarii TaxID=556327 RepID=A0ABP3FC73_9GAMM|nr:cell division protein ZipA C-terminal FtsZ-binding domain-containing protein [Psychrobacter aestuarii]
MTAIQFILIVIAALIVLAGLFMVMRSLKQRQDVEQAVVNYDKNGIPIIPRHERNLPDMVDEDMDDEDEADDSQAAQTPSAEVASSRVKEHTSHKPKTYKPKNVVANDNDNDFGNSNNSADTQQLDAMLANNASSDDDYAPRTVEDDEDDAFSSLVSATDHIMPPIETADEPDFTENSPILDRHLIESADDAQNAPLIYAEDNLNITIMPHQYRDRPANIIRGRDLLALVDKYGLRFGAMNMFHRYENKDGTGILWFSMMGVTDNGIAPFDPHNVATSTYNGVVLFLSLPHPQALMGFDGMMSIAYMMASDLNAEVLDENNDPISSEYKQVLRNQVREYGI